MSDTKFIERFFDELSTEFICSHMFKYIDEKALRDDFVRETAKAIAELKRLREEGGEMPEIFEICEDIPFWFNSFDPTDVFSEAEDKIYKFVEEAAGVSSDSDSE